MGNLRFWRCRDCERIYDIDVDKCVECGSDDWEELSAEEYIDATKDLIRKLRVVLKPKKPAARTGARRGRK